MCDRDPARTPVGQVHLVIALANRLAVELEVLGEEEPVAEAVIVLARYRPGGSLSEVLT